MGDVVPLWKLSQTDQEWLHVIQHAEKAYQGLRENGIPETEALQLTLANLLDAIRNTYRI